jgi:hypothetical protein
MKKSLFIACAAMVVAIGQQNVRALRVYQQPDDLEAAKYSVSEAHRGILHSHPRSGPQVGSYSNSGCLPGRDECGEDQIELTVGPHTLHALHMNALYNCCPDDIVISVSLEGTLLRLTEEEILTTPCDCNCCYNVEATVVNIAPGPYTVEFCWFDNDIHQERCYVEDVEIPESGPRMGDYSNSGCLPVRDECGEDEIELTAEPGTLHVLHRNALYNCCLDEITISVSLEGALLRLTEEEVLTDPCFCVCCYDVAGTVIDLLPGSYTVEYCWFDYDIEEERCYVEEIEIPEPGPRMGGYSNSGCLPSRQDCGEDVIELTPGPGTLHVLHMNALYNCCLDEIVISVLLEGDLIKLTEEEILTFPCWCECCYDVEGTVIDLEPGAYTVEFCWFDYDIDDERCYTEDVVIPPSD